ncbi:MAG: uncharacterized protein JWN99_2499 [Ilumatobacteraceae bacterium]|nr:uncharacterized protein [Ilumatobacteraceae bacterium]
MPMPPDGDNVLAIAFGDSAIIDHPDRPMTQLAAAWSGRPLIGCSTGGQVLGDTVLDHALVVTVVQFESTEVRFAHADLARSGSARRAGRELATALAEPGLAAIFVLVDGLSVNGTALTEGICDVLPDVPVSGGLAADGDRFAHTWTVVDGELVEGHVSAVGFIGDDVEIGFGSMGGWEPFGPDRLVTRSFGNVVYELDGRPASDLYLQYLGDLADRLPSSGWLLPLAVKDLDGRVVVRSVRAVHVGEGSITFIGDIAQGATVQLMRGSVDGLVHGAHLAAKRATTGHECLAIAISSMGRRAVLGERSEEELDAVLAALPDDVVLVGFHGFGELAHVDGTNDVYDQTMTITTLGERVPVSVS